MSYLTQSAEELQREVIASLEGEGFAYNELTTSFPKYLATCLGAANAYKTKSVTQMLAELNVQFDGSAVSRLTSSYAQLLGTLNATLSGGGGGGNVVPDDAVIHMDLAAGFYWMGEEVALADILDLDTATTAARGILIEAGKNPFLKAAALAVVNGLAASGLTQVTTWDADRCDNNIYVGPAFGDNLDFANAENGAFGREQPGFQRAGSYDDGDQCVMAKPAWMSDMESGIHKVGITFYRPDGVGDNAVELASEEAFQTASVASNLVDNAGTVVAYWPFGTVDLQESGDGTEPLYASVLTIFPAVSAVRLQSLVAE